MFHITMATHNCGILSVNYSSSGLGPMHFLSQIPTIHSYHTPFSLLAWPPNLSFFFLKQSFAFSFYLFHSQPTAHSPQHTHSQQSYHSPFSLHGRTTGEHHQSFHHFTQLPYLSIWDFIQYLSLPHLHHIHPKHTPSI